MNRRKVIAVLAAVVLATGFIALILAFKPKSTVVELTVLVDQISFTTLPPRPPQNSINLLYETVKVFSMEWRGAEKIDLMLSKPAEKSASIPLTDDSIIRMKSNSFFTPSIRLLRQTRVTILPYRRNQAVIALSQQSGQTGGWIGQAAKKTGLHLKIDGSDVLPKLMAGADSSDGWVPISSAAISGGHWQARLGVRLIAPKPTTLLRIIDPKSGQVSPPSPLSFHLPKDHLFMPFEDRIAFFERQPEDPDDGVFFDAEMDIQQPEFYRLRAREEESFLKGGRIRFPAGEKSEVILEPGLFLDVRSTEPFKLRSLRLIDGLIELVLWAKPTSISLGPTLRLSNQLLPSSLVWLYTHKLGTLVFSTIAWFVGAYAALLKFIGLAKI